MKLSILILAALAAVPVAAQEDLGSTLEGSTIAVPSEPTLTFGERTCESYYDGCNTHTVCSDGTSTSTLVACPPKMWRFAAQAPEAEPEPLRVFPPPRGWGLVQSLCTDENRSVFLCIDKDQRRPLCYDTQHGGFFDCAQVKDHDHERGMRVSRALIGGAVDGLSTIIALEENPGAYEGNPLLKSKDRIILAQLLHAGVQIGAGELAARAGKHGLAKWMSRGMLLFKILLGAHNLRIAFDGPGGGPGDAEQGRTP